MKQRIKEILFKLSRGALGPVICMAWNGAVWLQLLFVRLGWCLKGARRPSREQQRLVREQVTFLFKSFERQPLAKKLYRNIQRYYPGVRVIIVDDSQKPLKMKASDNLRILQLPFNVGLSMGLSRGLAMVETPFVIRMDDDELLTPYSRFHDQLSFLMTHPAVDMVGILPMKCPIRRGWKRRELAEYVPADMANAPEPLKIPHRTRLDPDHVVLGKIPNIFVARTEPYRAVGYDDQIRMIDHHEFFFRAAGHLVAVLDHTCFVLHNHCPFDYSYERHRTDIMGDKQYIALKHAAYSYFTARAKESEQEESIEDKVPLK